MIEQLGGRDLNLADWVERSYMKWSGKFGQRAKVYPTRMNGYENDEATELFRQVQGYGGT